MGQPLFPSLPNHWTPVLRSADLAKKPVKVRVAGTDVAVFRGGDGVSALLDRCPHRGVSLSLGKVENGCLSCPFHGWEFKGDGTCQHVPFNPDLNLDRIRAVAIPVREAGGLIWLFTGLKADHEPYVPEALTAPGMTVFHHVEDWDTHWTRAMENMLDMPHLPYVHRWTIGNFIRPYMTRKTKALLTTTSTPTGYHLNQQIGDRTTGGLDWSRPNGMILDTIPPETGKVQRMHVWCVPIDETHTRMILVGARNFMRFPVWGPLLVWFNVRVLREDRAVVESSDPPVVPPPSEEVNVPTDGPTLRFRSWYYKHVRGGQPEPAELAG